jgi:intracellular sulfur oxidation DsrE/DsrF family protein
MKTILNLIVVCLFSTLLFAQEKPVKIVFDVTSSDTKVHKTAVRHVKLMSDAYPNSKFELVVYSGAYKMVLKKESTVTKEMEVLASSDNVDLVVCQGSLNKHKIGATQLLEGVRTVPDGILEIVNKQGLGWGYIKESQ